MRFLALFVFLFGCNPKEDWNLEPLYDRFQSFKQNSCIAPYAHYEITYEEIFTYPEYSSCGVLEYDYSLIYISEESRDKVREECTNLPFNDGCSVVTVDMMCSYNKDDDTITEIRNGDMHWQEDGSYGVGWIIINRIAPNEYICKTEYQIKGTQT